MFILKTLHGNGAKKEGADFKRNSFPTSIPEKVLSGSDTWPGLWPQALSRLSRWLMLCAVSFSWAIGDKRGRACCEDPQGGSVLNHTAGARQPALKSNKNPFSVLHHIDKSMFNGGVLRLTRICTTITRMWASTAGCFCFPAGCGEGGRGYLQLAAIVPGLFLCPILSETECLPRVWRKHFAFRHVQETLEVFLLIYLFISRGGGYF